MISYVCNNFAYTWSDNQIGHTSECYHCALLLCDFEDYPVLQLDNHTVNKDTFYLHVSTEYVSEDYPDMKLDSHTDYKST